MDTDNATPNGAPPAAPGSGGPTPAAGPRAVQAYMTTATGERVPLPPGLMKALQGANGAGGLEIAQADGTRLTLQPTPRPGAAPAESSAAAPGGGDLPVVSLDAADTASMMSALSSGGTAAADGPVVYRKTTADRYAEVTGSSVPPAPPAPGADGTLVQDADDPVMAAALQALAPESAGRVHQTVVVPAGPRPAAPPPPADPSSTITPSVPAASAAPPVLEPLIAEPAAAPRLDPPQPVRTEGPPVPPAASEPAAPVQAPPVEAPVAKPIITPPPARVSGPEPTPPVAPPETRPGEDTGLGVEDPGAQSSMERADAANTELRSEEIDEILTSMPGGLLRWGSTIVFVTIALLLAIAWYIRYPDVVQGHVSLTTLTPPVRVVSRTAGEVARVFVADRAPVRANQPLLLLKSPAAYGDVQALSAALDRLEPALQRTGPLPDVAFDHPLALGDLQNPFSTFQQTYSDYRSLLADPFYGQKLAALQAQIGNLEQLRERLKAQQSLLDEQLALADRNRGRSRQLGTQNLSSSAEVDQAEQQYLQQRYATENGRTAITNNEIQLSTQRSSLIDLQQRRTDDQQRLLVQLRNAHHSLRAAITAWEQSYLLRSPVSGTVSLFRDVHENQFVSAQDPLVAVLPAAGAIVGRVTLSGMGAGKVRVGQRVIVQLESYPYKEYGTVEGRVTRISQLGFESQAQGAQGMLYQADVELPKGLVTSYGRRLEFTQEMSGVVQVVTDDVSLLMRVFNQIRSLKEV
jgi:multidrug resistance efflux pump